MKKSHHNEIIWAYVQHFLATCHVLEDHKTAIVVNGRHIGISDE